MEPLDRMVRLAEVIHLTGMSRVTIWKWEREGKFPKKVFMNGRTIAWKESALREWLDSRNRTREM